ncbi:unnamed protein product [Heterotrigona itama]|uniref:Uncharacterized protein n=1 Tax=Heterotrigona itama TaxID=395501 RepID=A0A6V7GVD4_9HYME|nr:unnamed protein product [Heterotrigona itama]
MPIYTEFLDFLEKRENCGVEITQRSPTKQSHPTERDKKREFATDDITRCYTCPKKQQKPVSQNQSKSENTTKWPMGKQKKIFVANTIMSELASRSSSESNNEDVISPLADTTQSPRSQEPPSKQ